MRSFLQISEFSASLSISSGVNAAISEMNGKLSWKAIEDSAFDLTARTMFGTEVWGIFGITLCWARLGDSISLTSRVEIQSDILTLKVIDGNANV